MVTGYFEGGKKDYNNKLKSQLSLSGKSYFLENREELPTSVSDNSYAYVSVPEMQSTNYITNNFVDSEGRECSPSYVYAYQKSVNSNEYEYIPCLICQDENGNQVNYSEDQPYCVDIDAQRAPTCVYQHADYNETTPIYLQGVNDEKEVKSIVITNINTRKRHIIDTSGKSFTEIEQIDIAEEMRNSGVFNLTKDQSYQVTLRNEGPTESKVCIAIGKEADVENDDYCQATRVDNSVTITAAADSGINRIYYVKNGVITNLYSAGEKYIDQVFEVPLDSEIYMVSNNESEQEESEAYDEEDSDFGVDEDEENEYIDDDDEIDPEDEDIDDSDILDENADLSEDSDNQNYPGMLCDENIASDIECYFTTKPMTKYTRKAKTIKAVCKSKIDEAIKVNNLKRIAVTTDKAKRKGKITSRSSAKNSDSQFTVSLKYNPSKNKGGKETISIKSKVAVKATDSTKYNPAGGNYKVLVDTKSPKVKIAANEKSKSAYVSKTDSTYKKKGFKKKVKVDLTCTDNHSGIKTFKYRIDKNKSWKTVKGAKGKYTYTKTITLSGKGLHKVQVSCKDIVGNKATKKTKKFRVITKSKSCKVCGAKKYNRCCLKYKTTTSSSYCWKHTATLDHALYTCPKNYPCNSSIHGYLCQDGYKVYVCSDSCGSQKKTCTKKGRAKKCGCQTAKSCWY